MIACATVRPPIPESKTPTGAVFGITTSPFERGGDNGAAVARENAKTDPLRQVPEIRSDKRIGAGKEMIRDKQRRPILDVRATRANVLAAKPRWGRLHHGGSLAVDVRDDQRVVLRAFGF